MLKIYSMIAALLMVAMSPAYAQLSQFHEGPVFKGFGKIASVDTDYKIPKGSTFKVSFDVSKKGGVGKTNRTLDTAARFINMHVAAGVPLNKINVAVVVHGGASQEMTKAAYYGAKHGGKENFNKKAIAALIEKGVKIIICGQSAAYYGVKRDDLLPGVQMALSAMTAHALLQQDGYTINPF